MWWKWDMFFDELLAILIWLWPEPKASTESGIISNFIRRSETRGVWLDSGQERWGRLINDRRCHAEKRWNLLACQKRSHFPPVFSGVRVSMQWLSEYQCNDCHNDDDRIVHKWWWLSSRWWSHRTQMMMIAVVMMIASYTNDDDCRRDDDCIVHKWWWSS